ncbi:ribonucleoside triphosphate reductase [Candidatus Pacearchaeota archaeon]|nr:ribonucleoside triphosphate reductase [Candidatus Pacearchaeota archaeon]
MTTPSSYELKEIKKRDGTLVQFDKEKIHHAILKAVLAVGGDDTTEVERLTDIVLTKATGVSKEGNKIITVEEIQDLVEKALIEEGHAKTAKAYILYRNQRKQTRDARAMLLDINKVMGEYLNQDDWRVKENSNISYSSAGLLMHLSGTLIANYTLNNIYPTEIAEAHKNGDFHLHDLSMGIMGYCAGWSLRQLLTEGFNGVPGKIDSVPPKHLNSVIWLMINFIGTLQNEWAGAQAFSSFDTYLAPFIKADNLSYDEVYQCIQAFVFNMNVPSRWGAQTPFSNITLDWVVPEDMKNKPAIIGGKEMDFTYGNCQKEMDMVNKAFIETMMKGDAKGRIFTFPIPTYNITRDFDWNNENANLLFEMTSKYGTPYFQNFINSELNPEDVRSMCCRLQMDMRELKSRGGGLFGSGELTGSVGVVTIDLPRIGYVSKTEEEFFEQLKHLMDLAKESLEIKRKIVQKNIDDNFMPYTKRYLVNLTHHFSTIGLVGMNECLMNFFGKETQIYTQKGKEFAQKVLDYMREILKRYQEETGHLYNLEATPAEGTSYRLAKIDKEKYPEILTQGKNDPYYTNSTQLPVNYTGDIFEALELQDSLQTRYTGGTVLHGFMGEKISDPKICKELVKRIAYNFRLPYFTITPTFSVCPTHGYLNGEHEYCPICDEDIIKKVNQGKLKLE